MRKARRIFKLFRKPAEKPATELRFSNSMERLMLCLADDPMDRDPVILESYIAAARQWH